VAGVPARSTEEQTLRLAWQGNIESVIEACQSLARTSSLAKQALTYFRHNMELMRSTVMMFSTCALTDSTNSSRGRSQTIMQLGPPHIMAYNECSPEACLRSLHHSNILHSTFFFKGIRVPVRARLVGGSIMFSGQLYDTMGTTYTVTRRTEPRIASQLWAALGDAQTVLNVGAGTGSYEPPDRDVTAVEPSAVMRAQRPAGAAQCVTAFAENLPFGDQSFDGAMAFATVHHWQDPIAGLLEMRRVARRVVVFTCDTSEQNWRRRFWLTRDYLPEIAADRVGLASKLADAIGARMEPVLIPWDCVDGFFEAYWRRPEAYLEEHVRRGISLWTKVGQDAEQRAVRSLREDLISSRWAERNRDILALDSAELGLRLVIA